MTNNADLDQLTSSLIWIYIVCKGTTYPGSTGLGLKQNKGQYYGDHDVLFRMYRVQHMHLYRDEKVKATGFRINLIVTAMKDRHPVVTGSGTYII